MSNIQGKVVAITGASSGIGEATARVLAAAGAHVLIGARRMDRLERLADEIAAAGGSVRVRRLDVTSRMDVEAFARHARSEFGRLDAIVNNAGVMPLSPLAALKVDEWDRMVDVNIKGVLYSIAAVLPIMGEQGRSADRQSFVDRRSQRFADGRRLLCDQVRRLRHLRRLAAGDRQNPRHRHLARNHDVRTRRHHYRPDGPRRDDGLARDHDQPRSGRQRDPLCGQPAGRRRCQ